MENVPHPSSFILDELAERGWSVSDLANAMPGSAVRNKFVCDLYVLVGPSRKNMRLGNTADDFAHALGVSREFFINLEKTWLAA